MEEEGRVKERERKQNGSKANESKGPPEGRKERRIKKEKEGEAGRKEETGRQEGGGIRGQDVE